MSLSILVGVLLLQGAFAYYVQASPADAAAASRSFASPKRYFSDFDVESLNPFNWIPNRKAARDENEIKFEALFEVLDCVTRDEPRQCGKLVEQLRPKFAVKVPTKPPLPTTAAPVPSQAATSPTAPVQPVIKEATPTTGPTPVQFVKVDGANATPPQLPLNNNSNTQTIQPQNMTVSTLL